MKSFSFVDVLLVSPALFLFLTSLVPLFLKVIRGNKELKPFISSVYVLIGVIFASVCAAITYTAETTAFYGTLKFDALSAVSNLLICILLSFTVIYSREHSEIGKKMYSEYLFLLVNAAIGMMILTWANHLIMVFIGLEVMSLSLYVLIAMSLEDRKSKESVLKYFVLGSFASAIFLYGCALLYGTTGLADFDSLAKVSEQYIGTNRMFLIGSLLFFSGIAFKVALFPFHSWSPDVYQGSPTPVLNFMASGVKLASFVVLLRFVYLGLFKQEISSSLLDIGQWVAALTILIGNVGALKQVVLKRLFAYSGIAHTGYLMLAVLVAGQVESAFIGTTSTIFYLVSYVVVSIGLFGVISLYERRVGDEVTIYDLKGLAYRNPLLAVAISIFVLSLAGIPPLMGFFAKFFVFASALSYGFYWLAVWGVIGSVISVYYYLRPMVYMYMTDEVTLGPDTGGKKLSYLTVGVMSGLVVIMGIAANPIYSYITASFR